jgi:hypothetical protein
MITIVDSNTKMPIMTCELPDGFKSAGLMEVRQYQLSRKIHLEMKAEKGNCLIGFQNGEEYAYEKKTLQTFFGATPKKPLGSRNESGVIMAVPVSLTDELDGVASSILQKKVKAKDYMDPSPSLIERMKTSYNSYVNNTVSDAQTGAQVSGGQLGFVIRNYLCDGGIGIYEEGKKIVAVFLNREGIEFDCVRGYGFAENITGEPFGQASDNMAVMVSSASWAVPFIAYMVSEDKKDLAVFLNFIESLKPAEEVNNYATRVAQEDHQYVIQQAQATTMRTQAEINMLNAAQQQRFAAMDRLSAQRSRDMDEWRANLNASIAQSDQRFNLGSSSSNVESSDDYIQRIRHEAIMGVETYERNDGSTVEYSNYADRVFESNLDNTTHFGTHHYYDDYVPEGWHEIKKK